MPIQTRMRAPSIKLLLPICVVALAAAVGSAAPGRAASTSTSVVGATVLSSTTIDAASCASGVLGRTDFGPVTAGSSNVTTLDCDIRFGSSNDTAQLRVRQSDVLGQAMFSPTYGVLDTSFDTDGRVTTDTGSGADQAWGVVVQPDGRIVTAGLCWMGLGTGMDMCLARYNPDGSLDATFDTDGRVTTAIAPGANYDIAYSMALQPNGRIVTAGWCDMGGATGNDFCLARYNANGSLDTTFDGDGRVVTAAAPGNVWDYARGVAIQPDGRIIAAGACNMGGTTGYDACLTRYNTDGSLDTTFDVDGIVTTAIGPGAAGDGANAVALQSDGRIVIAGNCGMGGATGTDVCVLRYNSDGSLDSSLDTDGRVTTAIAPGASSDSAWGVVVQDNGRIVTVGDCTMGGATGIDTCLVRYSANGSLDTTFDTDGIVTTATAPGADSDYASDVVLQSDGRIIKAGFCRMGGATAEDACLARYNTDGSLDTSFDGDGRVTTATGPGTGWDSAIAVAVRSDGRIVTAGDCDMGGATGQEACLASYAANGTLEQYADDGVRDWDTAGSAPSLFGACLRTVSGGASAQWATSATCPATDGAYWNDVPVASERIAYTTALEPDPPDATASLRFGLRAAGSQPAGVYLAPITFDVLAPNV